MQLSSLCVREVPIGFLRDIEPFGQVPPEMGGGSGWYWNDYKLVEWFNNYVGLAREINIVTDLGGSKVFHLGVPEGPESWLEWLKQ